MALAKDWFGDDDDGDDGGGGDGFHSNSHHLNLMWFIMNISMCKIRWRKLKSETVDFLNGHGKDAVAVFSLKTHCPAFWLYRRNFFYRTKIDKFLNGIKTLWCLDFYIYFKQYTKFVIKNVLLPLTNSEVLFFLCRIFLSKHIVVVCLRHLFFFLFEFIFFFFNNATFKLKKIVAGQNGTDQHTGFIVDTQTIYIYICIYFNNIWIVVYDEKAKRLRRKKM